MHRAAHHGGLDDVGPDDRADAARRGVDRGQRGDQHDRAAVNPDRLRGGRRGAVDHFVAEHDDDRRDVKPRAAGEQAREEEDGGGGVARGLAEAELQELVNRDDVVVVEGPDEEVGHDDAREDRRRWRAGRR